MKLLKTIGLSIALFFTTAASADKPVLDVYIASGNTGNSWVEGNMIRDALVELGYDSEVVWTKNCPGTLKYIAKGGARPGFFFRSVGKVIRDEQKGCTMAVDEQSFVMPMYVRLQAMCVRKDAGFTTFADFIKGKDKVTIATTNTLPGGAATYKSISEQTGKRFVRVDYDGSKKIIQGLLAGDTDMMYSGFTKREFGNPELQCFTTSADKEFDGLPAMKTLFPDWKLSTLSTYKYFHAVELPTARFAEVREALGKVLNQSEKFAPYVKNAKMVPGTDIADGLGQFKQVYNVWKN